MTDREYDDRMDAHQWDICQLADRMTAELDVTPTDWLWYRRCTFSHGVTAWLHDPCPKISVGGKICTTRGQVRTACRLHEITLTEVTT